MSTWESKPCPVCKTEVRLLYDPATTHTQVKCTACGSFEISDEVIRGIWEDRHGPEFRQRLSKALRCAAIRSAPPRLLKMEDVSYCLDKLDQDQQRKQRQEL